MASSASPVSHQIVRLERGRHYAPELGVCVMELASLLAGERFGDRPRCVCPVLGGFLRAYNDAIDDARRQDLYRYASAVVGTRSSDDVTRARARRAIEWGGATWASRGRLSRWFSSRPPARPPDLEDRPETAGAYAAHAACGDVEGVHESALAFLDELIRLGDPSTRLLPARFDAADIVPGEAPAGAGDAAQPGRRSRATRTP